MGLVQQPRQVGAVIVLAEFLCTGAQLVVVDPAVAVGDLVGRARLHPLPLLQRADEVARVQQAGMGAGVQPRIAAAHRLDVQPALVQVSLQQRRDLQLAAGRRLDRAGPARGVGVEEVEPRHRIVRRRDRWYDIAALSAF